MTTHLDRFHVRIDGPEGAPWLVFSNSLATDLTLWDHQVAAFGGRFRILRYDQRGHGGTPAPDAPATIEQLTNDVAALMAAAGAQDAIFVGVSMGAATGLCLAARPGSPVARLVAVDGQAATAPGGAETWEERIAFASANGMAAFADVTLPRWFSKDAQAEGNPAIPRVRAMIEATPLDGMIACARALQAYDVRAGLAEMRQPTLLIAGAEDGAMPQTMRVIQRSITGAEFHEIPKAGHLPCIERPEAFNAALETFLA